MASEVDQDGGGIRQELGSMSMEDLLALQSKIGIKSFREKILSNLKDDDTPDQTKFRNTEGRRERFGTRPPTQDSREWSRRQDFKPTKKPKDAPLEFSSKRVPRFAGQSQPPIKDDSASQRRDPRFDDRCGKFDKQIFDKNFEFVEELKNKEREELVALRKKKSTDPEMVEKINLLIQRLDNQRREAERRKKAAAIKDQLEVVNKGDDPQDRFQPGPSESQSDAGPGRPQRKFVAKSKIKKAVEEARREELEKSGKLNKFLERKEKRRAQQEKKRGGPKPGGGRGGKQSWLNQV